MKKQIEKLTLNIGKIKGLNIITGISVLLISGISFLIRYMGLKFISWDMRGSLFPWYDTMVKNGVWVSLSQSFSNYTPPYLYLLGLSTFTNSFLNRISAIKLVPLLFDVCIALITYKIVRLRFTRPQVALIAASLVFILPTAILNSSYWGQADAIYTFFLLACVYFLLTRRPFWGMLVFGVAFSFKLQAIFLVPFLLGMSLQKKLPWKYYLLIPATYGFLALPAGLAGRPWLDLAKIYLYQTQQYKTWSLNAATPYIFMPAWVPTKALVYFLLAAGTLVITWVLFTTKKIRLELPANLIASALACLALVPFVLPRMHERYFYPAEIFSLVLAFYKPRLWFLPLLFQASGFLVYSNYLFENTTNSGYLNWAFLIMSIAVVISIGSQIYRSNGEEEVTNKLVR
jgi:Gpi18-like mannosyltransferase